MVDHKKFSDSRTSLYRVDPRKLKIKAGLNARDLSTVDNRAHVEDLARSIKENGYLDSVPFEVMTEGDDVYVTAGHCRYAAVMLLIDRGEPIETVPYVPEPQGTNEIDRINYQRVSNSGKPLTPLEEGFNVKRLLGYGINVAEISRRWACSETHIQNLLSLQGASPEIRELVQRGAISATQATRTIRQEGDEAAATILTEAVEIAKSEGKSRATEKHVKARAEARDEVERFKIKHNAKRGMLIVRLGMTNYPFTPHMWLDFGRQIVAEAEKALTVERAARDPLKSQEEVA